MTQARDLIHPTVRQQLRDRIAAGLAEGTVDGKPVLINASGIEFFADLTLDVLVANCEWLMLEAEGYQRRLHAREEELADRRTERKRWWQR